MTRLKFTKMHGLGNDFMIIDAVRQPITLQTEAIRQLSRRDVGVGFDQCLMVEPSHEDGIDFYYRIFNADGNEVGQCGNGARCLARFVQAQGLTTKKKLTIATKTTRMTLHLLDDDRVTVEMNQPLFTPDNIPLITTQRTPPYTLSLPNQTTHAFYAVNVGNPHAVLIVNDVENMDLHDIGQSISEHPAFPEQTNVGFMQLISRDRIRLRVYERGCAETKACGSGAVAAAAVGRKFLNQSSEITVELLGGNLLIQWPSLTESIYLTGPATFVYDGLLSCGQSILRVATTGG